MSQKDLQNTLLSTIESIKQDPTKAHAVFNATTKLENGVCCSANVRDFPTLTIDEPPALGGNDSGMNPVELVLAALGTCQEIMFAAYAAVIDVQLDEVSVNVSGDLDLHGLFALDESTPAGFHTIEFDVHIQSPSAPETVRQLINMVQAHCPVLDIVRRPVTTNGRAHLNGAMIYDSQRDVAGAVAAD